MKKHVACCSWSSFFLFHRTFVSYQEQIILNSISHGSSHVSHKIHPCTDFAFTGYTSCLQIKYLTLIEDPKQCKDVTLGMNGPYALDDNGYWESYFEWGFADSMCSVEFVDFTTTMRKWKKTYSKNLWKVSEVSSMCLLNYSHG